MKTIGEQLKELRIACGITQREAAALVGVTPNTWARYERDELKPSRAVAELAILKLQMMLATSAR